MSENQQGQTISPEKAVLEFHKKYGHFIRERAGIPNQAIKDLRLRLILEECNEMVTALIRDDVTEIADGGADLVYVVVGTLISYGIPFDRIFQEVHRSNMTKTNSKAVEGEKYGTKTPKGTDYIPPDIKGILNLPIESTALEELYNIT
jgi:predicted HAD superfamily Cof-like phosphohydrolase